MQLAGRRIDGTGNADANAPDLLAVGAGRSNDLLDGRSGEIQRSVGRNFDVEIAGDLLDDPVVGVGYGSLDEDAAEVDADEIAFAAGKFDQRSSRPATFWPSLTSVLSRMISSATSDETSEDMVERETPKRRASAALDCGPPWVSASITPARRRVCSGVIEELLLP